MEIDLTTILFVLMASGIAFFIGSVFSPHAKAYRKEAQTWQGMYSGLKRSIQADIDANPPDQITSILSNPIVKALLPSVLSRLNLDPSLLASLGLPATATKEQTTQKTITWQ